MKLLGSQPEPPPESPPGVPPPDVPPWLSPLDAPGLGLLLHELRSHVPRHELREPPFPEKTLLG